MHLMTGKIETDVYCLQETDKATMDVEAQDEGLLAKIIVSSSNPITFLICVR